ncbi:MAG: cytochrome c family protein [Alphaproteobacteria bacterium]|nr:cytochrome c family protein [Alphaproteobacteria bacterium]MBU0796463.1 cytochrome c family protein [Alphaproteobacteria bacterium]MBU0888651.1 cytochrome c family protein [Alphaproteobacteria bacterium]MBU1813615.1 cytochrome c family protein [Alphaproteobacteria bacterium]
MSTFELNKIAAGILLGALLFMVTGTLGHMLVAPKPLQENAYKVEVAEEANATAAAPQEVQWPEPIAPLLASADAAAGEALTRRCTACHTFDKGGPNRVGPNLYGIVNTSKAHLEGFAYSTAMAEAEGEWTYENLSRFLFSPRDYVPGTKMNYAGLRSDKDRANLIAYLRSLADSPAPLPQ